MGQPDDPPEQPGPKVIGRSPGGSRLLKYSGGELTGSPIGFPDEDVSGLAEAREAAYERLFGRAAWVHHEMMPFVPHVDVYVVEPRPERPFYTLVTGGMSDLPMNSPPELGPDVRRVELVFYAASEEPEYVSVIRSLAHFPHNAAAWLFYGHTMPNGAPPRPIFGAGALDAFYFTDSVVGEDASLADQLSWHGEPINLLWMVPITTAECEFKLAHGSSALLDLFERQQHPFVFAGARASYV